MKLASFDALVKALDDAHVRYLVAGCPQDKSDVDHLRKRLEDGDGK